VRAEGRRQKGFTTEAQRAQRPGEKREERGRQKKTKLERSTRMSTFFSPGGVEELYPVTAEHL